MKDLVWAPAYASQRGQEYHEPQRKTDHAAAYDLYLPRATLLCTGDVTKINLNLVCAMPQDERAVFMMRSSLADRYNFQIVGGLIDSDYPEGWALMIYVPDLKITEELADDSRHEYDHTCQESFLRFKQGERIAQVKFEKVPAHKPRTGTLKEVQDIIAARGSNRTSGFGSTGT